MKRALLILLAATLAFSAPAFFNPNGIRGTDDFRNLDWLSCRLFDAYLYKSVWEFGQFPLWCPYLGGGYPVYQHPTDGSRTPLAIPVLLLGEIYGVKVNLMILMFLGGLGVFLIARRLFGWSETASLFSALSFLLAGWLPSRMLVGYYNQMLYFLVPLIVYFLVRAFDNLRFSIPAGLLSAWFAFQATWGVFALALFCASIAVVSTVVTIAGRPRLSARPFLAFMASGTIALALFLPRALDIRDLIGRGDYPHVQLLRPDQYERVPIRDWFYYDAAHFMSSALRHVPKQAVADERGWPVTTEYAHLGIPWLSFLFFFVSAAAHRRLLLPWILSGAFFLVLCFGPASPVDLYRWLIWPFESLRDITDFYKYFNFFVYFVIALVAGGALEWIAARLGKPHAKKAIAAFSFAALLPFAAVNSSLFAELFRLDLPSLDKAVAFHQVKWVLSPGKKHTQLDYREDLRPKSFIEYYNLKRNVGTIDWYADIYLPENAIPKYVGDPVGALVENPSYRGEAFFAEGGGHQIEFLEIRSNTITVMAQTSGPATLVVNQNRFPGWQVLGAAPAEYEGLLAARLSGPGSHRIEFRFRPLCFYLGLIWSLLALTGCAVVWVRSRPRGQEG